MPKGAAFCYYLREKSGLAGDGQSDGAAGSCERYIRRAALTFTGVACAGFVDWSLRRPSSRSRNSSSLSRKPGARSAGTTSGMIDAETLVTTVSAIVRRNPEIQVLVGGDERVGYGEVYNAMVLLQKAGVLKVGLMSDPLDIKPGAEPGSDG